MRFQSAPILSPFTSWQTLITPTATCICKQPGQRLTAAFVAIFDDRAQFARHVIKKAVSIGRIWFPHRQSDRRIWAFAARWFSELLLRHFRERGGGAGVDLREPLRWLPRDFGIYIDKSTTDDVRQALRTVARTNPQSAC